MKVRGIKIYNYDELYKREQEQVKTGLQNAISFIKKRYNISLEEFLGVEVKHKNKGNPWFIYAGKKNEKPYIIAVKETGIWSTYRFKIGYDLYAKDIDVDKITGYSLQFVHELTHYIQYLQDRRYSEMETTKNEIEWVEMYRPHYYTFVKERKKKCRHSQVV